MIPDFERCCDKLGLPPPSPGQLECLQGNARSAEMRTQYTCDSEEIDPLHFAAFLLHQVGKVRHCLTDGNKRIAWFSMLVALSDWELTVDAEDDEAEAFVLGIAAGQLEPEDAMDWLQQRLVALPDEVFF